VVSTVGCGDYLLAGFLAGLADTDDAQAALATGLQVAAARAWAWTETRSWADAVEHIKVDVRPL
jgi:fructose-1-phosphate kinase PfkB-like protein